jgi:hypothetical protein
MTDNASAAWRAATFRKSSYSGQNAQCVEVARAGTMLGVRDSKNPVGPVLAVTIGPGHEFLAAIKREQIAGH